MVLDKSRHPVFAGCSNNTNFRLSKNQIFLSFMGRSKRRKSSGHEPLQVKWINPPTQEQIFLFVEALARAAVRREFKKAQQQPRRRKRLLKPRSKPDG
jgi:hypothetical protein